MDTTVANQESTPTQSKGVKSIAGVSYPIETIENILQVAYDLVSEHGTGKPISKEDIGKAVNKSPNGLSLYYSTFVQYGIFITVHGKGYAPTDLYRKYMNPVHDGDERKCMLEMFKKPSLYAKIIENQNGHVLPSDSKRLGNMLKDEPYNVTEYAAEKAAKVFLENARNLGLMDSHNVFSIEANATTVTKQVVNKNEERHDTPPPPQKPQDGLFELPIPLPKNRIAYLRYPRADISKKDISVIKLAIAFIEGSLPEDDDL